MHTTPTHAEKDAKRIRKRMEKTWDILDQLEEEELEDDEEDLPRKKVKKFTGLPAGKKMVPVPYTGKKLKMGEGYKNIRVFWDTRAEQRQKNQSKEVARKLRETMNPDLD
jgi:hypothetical protein